MIENVFFELIKGDTYERNIIIEKYTSEISQKFFSVKSKATDKRVILQKSLDNGITLMDTDNDKRTYQIFIESTDTDNMKTGDYFFDVEIITPTKTIPIKRTIVKGTFRLNTEITTTDNERGA